jgi:multidrug efflux system membrane fusion protein
MSAGRPHDIVSTGELTDQAQAAYITDPRVSEQGSPHLFIKMNTQRWPSVPLILSLFAATLLAACSKPAEPPALVRSVRTQVLAEASGSLTREFAAEVRARTESRLGFRVGGKVTRRLVELGQHVQAGQPLVQLDPQDLKLTEDVARAGLASAQAQASQAAADLRRFKELRAQGFISEAELERHTTNELAAQAALRQARAQAGVQANQAGYAVLTATAAGVITGVEVEPGQVVAAGQPVLTLAHDGARDAVFAVPEDFGPMVRPLAGKAGGIQVRRWGSADPVRATVREVAAATDPITRTYLVKADVTGSPFDLGQTATVVVRTPIRVPSGLPVPLPAVLERDGKSVVWVLEPGSMTVQPQAVVTSDVLGNIVLVAQGLKPGQEVVTAGAHVLQPGQKVRRFVEATAAPAKPAAASSPRS